MDDNSILKRITKRSNRFFELDLIRCVAMLCIFLFHFGISVRTNGITYEHSPYSVGRNIILGQQGVSLFFILSGCTSVLSYENILNKKPGDHVKSVFTYYAKRLLGILPLYWCVYFVAFLLLRAPGGDLFSFRYLFTLTGFDGYLSVRGIMTPYLIGEWFIGTVLILYFLFPLLYSCIWKYPGITAVILTVFFVLFNMFYPFKWDREIGALMRIPEFCFGIYYAKYIRGKHGWETGLCSLAVLLVCLLTPLPINYMYAIAIQGISSFMVLAWVGKHWGITKAHFVQGSQIIVTVLAGVSYGIFLTHHFLMEWILPAYSGNEWTTASWLRLFCYIFLLSLVLAVLLRYPANAISNKLKRILRV